jgi:hypothetical protein
MNGKITLLTVYMILWLTANGLAQGAQTGTIRGTVTDAQNTVMPGVTVTATSPSLQGSRSVLTDGQGGFSLRNLPAGNYDIRFELSGFTTVKQKSTLPLGLTLEENVTMQPANVEVTVTVAAETPAPITTPIVGANFKHDEIDALATPRTLQGIATLAPGLTTNTPNRNQVVINGAFAFDNVFMVNGVDINDNLFGSPQDLFIEDGIEETQVLTSGLPAEYGRFTGGVVNAITKSGGNSFSGSFRTNFSNPQWTTQTPFETCEPAVTTAGCSPAPERPDDLQFVYEGTVGGPVVKDRLWFFGAGRYSKLSNASTLPITNLANVQTDTNKRGEIKVTGTVEVNHTIQGGYLNSPAEQASRPTFSFTIDPAAVVNPTYPNWYTFVNYRGVLGKKFLGEAQYSTRKYRRLDTGGTSTDFIESPIITLTQQQAHYNAPYFDSTDPEDRNNSQLTGNFTYFLDSGKRGRHEIKGGYEWFRSQNIGGNSQTATGYVIYTDYTVNAAGNPRFDANGRLIPTFVPNRTENENWIPVRGALINVDTQSLFAQDHWAINSHWSADLGVRYERARTEATGGLIGIDTDTIVPRLGTSFDVHGNGRHIVHVTYGHYAGRYNEAQVGANTNVGNPDVLFGVYVGPPGEGRDFAPGFDPSNYVPYGGDFPTNNVFFEDGLSAPIVKEFTTSYGTSLGGGRGYVEATYIWRDTQSIIEDFISLSNGVTTIVENGFEVGTFTNKIYRNTDIANRAYQALEFQGRQSVSSRWTLNGSYTLQLTNDGNYEGEATNQPGVPSQIGDYPEIFHSARHFPDGHLFNFQRHKLVLWTVYNAPLGRFGDASISGLWRVNSGTTYSLAATGQRLTAIQTSMLSAAGYPDAPTNQTLYFEERGSGQFVGYGVLDFDVNYNVPVSGTKLRPWVKFDIYNLFNNQKLTSWNTTVSQDPNTPTDSLGLATGYRQGSSFGKATANTNFPQPFYAGQVQTGGRTFLLAVGFRF